MAQTVVPRPFEPLWEARYSALAENAREHDVSFDSRWHYVGKNIPRHDAFYKVLGKAGYAANISLPGMLQGKFLRSPHAYAKIKHIDVSKARALDGVAYVLTAHEIAEERLYVGSLIADTPILAKTVVRHVGEPVVAVAAETMEKAQSAIDLIDVEYEVLSPVVEPREALAEGAPLLHPGGNTIVKLKLGTGDVDEALATADAIVEGTYVNHPIEHCHLEPQAGVSFIDENGVLTLLVCTQYPHFHHRQLARITGLPFEKVRVIPTTIGGAFGGKNDVTIECASCLMTLATGRPVKMVLDREEVFTATIKRHAMEIRHRLAARSDGRLTGVDVDLLCDGGAYASYSMIVAGRCAVHAALPYEIDNVKAQVTTAFTNNVPSGAMRSFGVVKLAFALETQINKMANQLGISPIAIRRINAVRNGSKTVTGQILQDAAFIQTLDAIEPIYERRRREIAAEKMSGPIRRGLGVASLGYGIGYSGIRNPSRARIEVDAAGKVHVFCGTPDIGTGSDTVMAQIAAEAISVNMARVAVTTGDSTYTDDSGPTSASRTTFFSGNAVRAAGEEFRRQFIAAAAARFYVAPESIRFEDDHLIIENRVIPFGEACGQIGEKLFDIKAHGICDPNCELDLKTFQGNTYPTYTYATHLAEVAVDIETGKVSVPRYWAAHDAGRIMNPVAAEGQIEGGVVMGIGMALWEKIVRSGGYIENPSYRDYLLVGTKDAPADIKVMFVENNDTAGPFGAKGVAEASIVPVPAAVAAAINNAVGVMPRELPMTAESIVRLLTASDKVNC